MTGSKLPQTQAGTWGLRAKRGPGDQTDRKDPFLIRNIRADGRLKDSSGKPRGARKYHTAYIGDPHPPTECPSVPFKKWIEAMSDLRKTRAGATPSPQAKAHPGL